MDWERYRGKSVLKLGTVGLLAIHHQKLLKDPEKKNAADMPQVFEDMTSTH